MSTEHTVPSSTRDEILKGLSFLHPKIGRKDYGVVELCAACPGARGNNPLWEGFAGGKEGLVTGWFDDADKLSGLASDLDAGWVSRDTHEHPKAIYVTLNPCDSALLGRSANRLKAGQARTSDKDVVRIHNILVDIDAKRPSGVSASAAEKKLAVTVTKRVKDWLMDDCFWPAPLIADSGNGGHLVFKAFFPDGLTAQDSAAHVKELLKALDRKFRTKIVDDDGREVEVGIDTTVYNPSRLVKLWGTFARKGDATKDRPHRQSTVISVPDQDQGPVTLPMIETVLGVIADEFKGEDLASGERKPANVKEPYSKEIANPFKPVADAGGAGNAGGSCAAGLAVLGAGPGGAGPGGGKKGRGGKLDVGAYLEAYGVEVVKVDQVDEGNGAYERWCLKACVFDASHGPNEAFIGQGEDGKIFYRCFHQSCQEYKWKDARGKISGEDSLGRFMVGGEQGEGGGDCVAFPAVNKDGKPYARYENFAALVEAYGIEIRYNIMGKHEDIRLPGELWSDSDRLRTLARDYIEDLCARHGLGSQKLDSWIRMRGELGAYHPARVWLESKEWDGVPRFEQLLATVRTSTPNAWRTYLRRWLIQGVAALYEHKFCCRGVLTFTGAQGVGKTSWFKSLVPENLNAFGEGLNLDPADKDSTVITLSKWIVELGEVDATFRKADISKLKAFLTKEKDILRVPYGRAYDHWKRMTVWGATVNDPQFLMDGTGNTRWWCIETEAINWRHGIDMQQVWAEAKTWYDIGESWFLDEKETDMLNILNENFEVVDPVKELIISRFQFDLPRETWDNWMTTTDVLSAIGYEKPSKAIATNAGVILKNLVGSQKRKRVNGIIGRYYPMPLGRWSHDSVNRVTEEDWLGSDNNNNGKLKH